jgi:WD40 repeat protein
MWQRGTRPCLARYLSLAGDGPEGQALREDLVLTDLEQRILAGDEAPLVEAYLALYPALKEGPSFVVEMIKREYQEYWRRAPGVRWADYQQRFPGYQDRLTDVILLWFCPLCGRSMRVADEAAESVFCERCRKSSPARPAGIESVAERLAPRQPQASGPSIPGYRILKELGRGGMGVVFLAHHHRLDREVALKMIDPRTLPNPSEVQRFLKEAKVVAGLDNPNVVKVYDSGEHENRPYFSMELCGGHSLQDQVASGPLSPKDAARALKQLAAALKDVHSQGVVHRDLKPSNVLLALDGTTLKITDFGLAKHLETREGEEPGLTRTGMVVGTPSYMAPEQARDSRKVTAAADIWSLGGILYALLTGRPPFLSEKVEDILAQAQTKDPVPPSQFNSTVPRDLETICLKCLEKEPTRRYATAEKLFDDLNRYLEDRPILARRAGPVEHAWKWAKRNRVVAGAATVILVTLLSAATVSTGYYLSERQARINEQQATTNERAARIAETTALEKEREARSDADTKEKESRQRLVRSYLREGIDADARGDLLASLPWLAEAYSQDREAGNKKVHQVRLTSFLRATPQVKRVFDQEHDVAGVDFSPDGEHLAIAAGDAVRVWSNRTGKLVTGPLRYDRWSQPGWPDRKNEPGKLREGASTTSSSKEEENAGAAAATPAQYAPMNDVAFSPDGKYVVTASDAAQVWDIATGQPVGKPMRFPLVGEGDYFEPASGRSATAALRVMFGPNTNSVITVWRSTVLVWDVRSGRCQSYVGGQDERLYLVPSLWSAGILPQLSAIGDLVIQSARLCTAPASRDEVSDAVLAPGRKLVLVGFGKRVIFFDLTTGKETGKPLEHPDVVKTLAISPDSKWIAAAGNNGTVMLWDAATRELRGGRKGGGRGACVAFSQDNRLLAITGADGNAMLLEHSTGKQVGWPLAIGGPAHTVEFSSSNQLVAVARVDGLVQCWDVRNGRKALPPLTGANKLHSATLDEGRVFSITGKIKAARFSPDGKQYLTATRNLVLLWDLALSPPAEEYVQPPADRADVLHQARIALSLDAKLLLRLPNSELIIRDKKARAPEARLYDSSTLRARPTALPGPKATHAAFRPDGQEVALAGSDGTVRVWHVASGKLQRSMEHGKSALWLVSYSPDGHLLATASVDGTARVWQQDGRPATPLLNHQGDIDYLAFSPDSQRLVTAGTRWTAGRPTPSARMVLPTDLPGQAKVWQIVTGKALPLVCTHDKCVRHASFSPDGDLIATASDDWSARVWNLRTAKAVSPPLRHSSEVYQVAFGGEQRFIATASLPDPSGAGEVRVWDALTGEPVTPVYRNLAPYDDRNMYELVRLDGASVWKRVPDHVGQIMSGPPLLELTTDHRLIVRGGIRRSWTWDLSPLELTPLEFVTEAQLRSGLRIDGTGAVVSADVHTAWRSIKR